MLTASLGVSARWYPNHQVLRAFIETIVPGADIQHPKITAVFYDETYWSDLNRWLLLFSFAIQSEKLYLKLDFSSLRMEQRIEVIEDGLAGKGFISKLFHAAIWLSHVMIYTGLFNADESCDLIKYPSALGEDQITYPNPGRYLGPSITNDGNHP